MSQFDTHTVIKQLIDAGMPEAQAEIIIVTQARLIDDRLATKQDLELVQHAIETRQLATEKEIESLRAEMKKDSESLRADIKKDSESLRAEMKTDIQLRLSQHTVHVGAMLVATIGVLGSLQAYFR